MAIVLVDTTDNSMMDGVRSSTMMEISFQSKPGSSELSCCSVNGPRMIGLLSEYAVMRLDPGSQVSGYCINLYTAGKVTAKYPGGNGQVVFEQVTSYPLDPQVDLMVSPSSGSPTFTLWLRIPSWSEKTSVSINGAKQSGVVAGKYFAIKRAWTDGDKVSLVLDFRLRCWVQPFPTLQDEDSMCVGCISGPCTTSIEAETDVGATAVAPPPKPLWSSSHASWPLNGKSFDGTSQLPVDMTQHAIGDGPTTMLGWVCPAATDEMIPFSFGAHMGSAKATNDCRALSIFPDDANYYMRGGPYDSSRILGSAKAVWSAAWKDGDYHHIAVSDTGTSFTLYLDGKALVTNTQHVNRKHKMNTAAGFVIGGWADENRMWKGALAGIQFYGTVLSLGDITAIMKSTKPTAKPPPPAQLVKGCLYRGPLLLGCEYCWCCLCCSTLLD